MSCEARSDDSADLPRLKLAGTCGMKPAGTGNPSRASYWTCTVRVPQDGLRITAAYC